MTTEIRIDATLELTFGYVVVLFTNPEDLEEWECHGPFVTYENAVDRANLLGDIPWAVAKVIDGVKIIDAGAGETPVKDLRSILENTRKRAILDI